MPDGLDATVLNVSKGSPSHFHPKNPANRQPSSLEHLREVMRPFSSFPTFPQCSLIGPKNNSVGRRIWTIDQYRIEVEYRLDPYGRVIDGTIEVHSPTRILSQAPFNPIDRNYAISGNNDHALLLQTLLDYSAPYLPNPDIRYAPLSMALKVISNNLPKAHQTDYGNGTGFATLELCGVSLKYRLCNASGGSSSHSIQLSDGTFCIPQTPLVLPQQLISKKGDKPSTHSPSIIDHLRDTPHYDFPFQALRKRAQFTIPIDNGIQTLLFELGSYFADLGLRCSYQTSTARENRFGPRPHVEIVAGQTLDVNVSSTLRHIFPRA